jgi:hypothetical protein
MADTHPWCCRCERFVTDSNRRRKFGSRRCRHFVVSFLLTSCTRRKSSKALIYQRAERLRDGFVLANYENVYSQVR